ncbi:SIR2 family protein [Halorubrum distributum]|uniref:Uncharacterized protein n=1 Tax=Halorubrum distributum TaxID=29283 RepID=A0A6B1INX5_9EURY|nr:SIR2 family protein [Halorubrum terrestre]MYL68970.1 hypothetical protein [Halorubrum terrestre]
MGSGISQRYIDAPNWWDLLDQLSQMCTEIKRPVEYYGEEFSNPEIGTEFVGPYRDWAWNDKGIHNHFDERVFEEDGGKDKYLKYKVAELLRDLSPDSESDLPTEYESEIDSLKKISPSAVITTNYDTLLETVFPGFERMIGQDIYSSDSRKVGDLFKIHGGISDPNSIVLTQNDYKKFNEEKKYISAKLLTYFTEHPVLILGHSASDENIQKILYDLDRMIPTEENDLIDNIFLVDYKKDPSDLESRNELSHEELIDVGEGRRVRVNAIRAHNFEWIFDAFSQREEAMDEVEVNKIREFTDKIYDITTKNAPRRKLNFERLEYMSSDENLEKLLGFVPIDNPETVEGLRQAGIPIGEGEISTEPVEDINQRLNAATRDYTSNNSLIDRRKTILEFRKRISDLDLNQTKRDFLLRSSLRNSLQGADWMVGYGDDIQDELKQIIDDPELSKSVQQRLEYTALVLNNQDLLEYLHKNYYPDNGLLVGPRLTDLIDQPIEKRVARYGSGTNILFTEDEVTTSELIGNEEETERLLNICSDILIEEENSDDTPEPSNATDFRKLELVKIANNIDSL